MLFSQNFHKLDSIDKYAHRFYFNSKVLWQNQIFLRCLNCCFQPHTPTHTLTRMHMWNICSSCCLSFIWSNSLSVRLRNMQLLWSKWTKFLIIHLFILATEHKKELTNLPAIDPICTLCSCKWQTKCSIRMLTGKKENFKFNSFRLCHEQKKEKKNTHTTTTKSTAKNRVVLSIKVRTIDFICLSRKYLQYSVKPLEKSKRVHRRRKINGKEGNRLVWIVK